MTPDLAAQPSPASRWSPVAAYATVSAANQMLWLTYAPITTDAAHHYGVSVSAIGWLAEIFPLVYVVLALPTGRVIDRWLRGGLVAGAGLTALGAVVRLTDDSYPVILLGQLIVAVAQPFVLNAVREEICPGRTCQRRDRATGIAVSSAGIFAGLVLALLTGTVAGIGHLIALLVFQAAFAVLWGRLVAGGAASTREHVRSPNRIQGEGSRRPRGSTHRAAQPAGRTAGGDGKRRGSASSWP